MVERTSWVIGYVLVLIVVLAAAVAIVAAASETSTSSAAAPVLSEVDSTSIDLQSGDSLRDSVSFRTQPIRESYRRRIIAITIIVIAQLVLIAGLLRQRAHLRRASESLRHSEATLRAGYDRIRHATGRLIGAQEARLAGIAQNLHDDICQRLVFVSMGLEDLMQASGAGEAKDVQPFLSNVDRDVQAIFDGLRRLSHELHPSALRLLGLSAALKAHCLEVSRQHNVKVTFTMEGDSSDAHPDVALCVFRIVEEALRNALEHGAPTECVVSLVRQGDRLELTVKDNGRGSDLERLRSEDEFRLVMMEERVHAVGGRFVITSEPGYGAVIHASVPVAPTGVAGQADPRSAPLPPLVDGLPAER